MENLVLELYGVSFSDGLILKRAIIYDLISKHHCVSANAIFSKISLTLQRISIAQKVESQTTLIPITASTELRSIVDDLDKKHQMHH